MGIRCVIRQFSVSQDLTGDMSFECHEFVLKFGTNKYQKNTEEIRKIPKKPSATANFELGPHFVNICIASCD